MRTIRTAPQVEEFGPVARYKASFRLRPGYIHSLSSFERRRFIELRYDVSNRKPNPNVPPPLQERTVHFDPVVTSEMRLTLSEISRLIRKHERTRWREEPPRGHSGPPETIDPMTCLPFVEAPDEDEQSEKFDPFEGLPAPRTGRTTPLEHAYARAIGPLTQHVSSYEELVAWRKEEWMRQWSGPRSVEY